MRRLSSWKTQIRPSFQALKNREILHLRLLRTLHSRLRRMLHQRLLYLRKQRAFHLKPGRVPHRTLQMRHRTCSRIHRRTETTRLPAEKAGLSKAKRYPPGKQRMCRGTSRSAGKTSSVRRNPRRQSCPTCRRIRPKRTSGLRRKRPGTGKTMSSLRL